ncbi:hypothetical protein LWI28_024120 [Acer negundo]|uniref:C2 NT-type domain-containing protein n=1 Tax=Acer negundo TaxID=4023 RepID=A0AAD5I7Z6_ACENE|nr:hypothetical protein LWI28_024120 [Acer negundo]KAK4833437.1 hypothetical protein QYF36_004975 [Acer negundo]
MFRLHKSNKPAKSGERIDFKFSQFKALQVPKGWDKLFVSIVNVETGKTIAKSGKSLVRNGTCQWTDTLSESIWISQEDSSTELEDCLFKLVVSMGSARSGILGETTLNMTGYMSSSAVVPFSIPLKKCNHGTVLQVKIHCLTPRTKREDESKDPISLKEDQNVESGDMDIKSDESYSTQTRSSSKELISASPEEEPESRGTSFSASGSQHSYDTAEGSEEGEKFSLRNNLTGDNGDKSIGKLESTSSQNNVRQGRYQVVKTSESNHSSNNSENTSSGNSSVNNQQELAASTLGISASSKSFLEAAETTIEELRAESKMWERNSQKLMLDSDVLRKEVSDLSKKQAYLETELSAACAERDGLRDEVEQLKLMSEKSMVKPTTLEESTFQDKGVTHIQMELEGEIKYQKESNTSLALQLKRSQESNIELVTVLQELEETIEKQKLEIENLSSLQSKFNDMENSIQVNIEENKKSVLQLQQHQESEKNLQAKVQLLEQALEENNQSLSDIQTDYEVKLSAKDDEIVSLEAMLSESQNEKYSADAELRREIEDLKGKLEELERDCTELTDENLDLLFKLKEIKSNSAGERASLVLSSSELLENSSSRSEVSDPESEVHNLEEKLKKKVSREIENHYDVQIQQLEIIKTELQVKETGLTEELSQKVYEIERLEAQMLSKEEKIKYLQHFENELQAKVASLQEENILLEGNMKIVSRESDIATKRLNDLQNDILVLSSSVDSHVSTNRTLEKKSSELESAKHELELHLSEVENENSQLSACISGLEAQLRSMMDERESRELELENSNSVAMNLQDEVTRLRNQIDIQNTHLKQKLEEMHNRWLEAEEECEYLRREHSNLQAIAKGLVEERSSIEKSNEDLRKQKFELQEQCTNLEAKLRESNESLAICSKKVSGLEENLSSLMEDIASKERSLNTQLDALLDEIGKQMEKLVLEETLSRKKTVEIENLQREIGNLTEQLSSTRNERERIASEAKHDISSLLEDKTKLECALEGLQSKVYRTENELAASKENQEKLMSNHEKVLRQLETYQSSEEKFKISESDLELKLTVCEYERQQLMEESTSVKAQLLRIEHLEDKILSLKNELDATKSEKDKLKTSLKIISGECGDLKVQELSFLEKISTLQNAVSELEDCKLSKALSEEKLLQMEDEQTAKQALSAHNIELKNQLSLIKSDNSRFQWKIQLLEEEKDKYLLSTQALEEELNLIKEGRQKQKETSSTKNSYSSQHQIEGNNSHERHNKSPAAARVDLVSKIQLLETELAKMREANKKYKIQLDRLQSEGRNSHAKARKPKGEGEVVTKERFERTKSSLESELKDIRERYLQMSLKYAEVEAQREELVMQLKIAKNGKRWFS